MRRSGDTNQLHQQIRCLLCLYSVVDASNAMGSNLFEMPNGCSACCDLRVKVNDLGRHGRDWAKDWDVLLSPKLTPASVSQSSNYTHREVLARCAAALNQSWLFGHSTVSVSKLGHGHPYDPPCSGSHIPKLLKRTDMF